MALDTDKFWIRDVATICAAKGITKAVLSPGSRCAPLVIAFNRHPAIECISIIDERSAAFFALGMAQQLQQTVVLICTSGTAALNYAPAIAEAYYQRIPLLVLTADRPHELIDQADGQTIRQTNIYANYIKRSFELPTTVTNEDEHWYSNRIVSEAINATLHPDKGPVHINIPLREPLYGLKDYTERAMPKLVGATNHAKVLLADALIKTWAASKRTMIVIGGCPYHEALNKWVNKIAQQPSVVVIAEITSNIVGENILNCPDSILTALNEESAIDFQPELVISFGGGIVSKKLKTFLRNHQPNQHWHIDPTGATIDTFKALTQVIAATPVEILEQLAAVSNHNTSDFSENWQKLANKTKDRHKLILDAATYCDLTVFGTILKHLPNASQVHLGNSTPIRYTGLFEPITDKHITYYCNRGTSGIDGVTSTAAGAAKATGKLTTVITGDVAFFYDSNALWNKALPNNLRIIIINNGGGNIFRVLKGSGEMPELEQFFETKMELSTEHIARTFGLTYYRCSNLEELTQALPKFFQPNDKCVILEIKTPAETSAEMMRKYLAI